MADVRMVLSLMQFIIGFLLQRTTVTGEEYSCFDHSKKGLLNAIFLTRFYVLSNCSTPILQTYASISSFVFKTFC